VPKSEAQRYKRPRPVPTRVHHASALVLHSARVGSTCNQTTTMPQKRKVNLLGCLQTAPWNYFMNGMDVFSLYINHFQIYQVIQTCSSERGNESRHPSHRKHHQLFNKPGSSLEKSHRDAEGLEAARSLGIPILGTSDLRFVFRLSHCLREFVQPTTL
jgi:hypothetical protein